MRRPAGSISTPCARLRAAAREEADRRTTATTTKAAGGAFHGAGEDRREVSPTAGWATRVAAVSSSPKWRTPVSPALIYMAAGVFRSLRSAETRAAFLKISNIHVGILSLPNFLPSSTTV